MFCSQNQVNIESINYYTLPLSVNEVHENKSTMIPSLNGKLTWGWLGQKGGWINITEQTIPRL